MNSLATVVEVNFDCLVGPTHHFGGLSLGNLASTGNKARPSNPKKAALQGLKKMKFLHDRGFVQAILPPHPRPYMAGFSNLGFFGLDHEMLFQAAQKIPEVFSSLCSSSAMWAANAATISPSADTDDGKLHLTPANLTTMLHRSIEHDFTTKIFKHIFANEGHFVVHDAVLAHDAFSDEGAANHNRLTKRHGQKGLEIFVYGKHSISSQAPTKVFPARQSCLANDAIIRRHKLNESFVLNVAQNPLAIDGGAFHNDVVCVVNENVMVCHALAFSEQASVMAKIRERYCDIFHEYPIIIEISDAILPLKDAVSSYLFNSQLLSKSDGTMMLFAPMDCLKNQSAHRVIQKLIADDNPINQVEYFDVSESMANGGGPACLRLRVVLSAQELATMRRSVLMSEQNFAELECIIEEFYVEDFRIDLLFQEKFLQQSSDALAAIAKALGSVNY